MACQFPASRASLGANPTADWSSRMARRIMAGTASFNSWMRLGLRSPVMIATPAMSAPPFDRRRTRRQVDLHLGDRVLDRVAVGELSCLLGAASPPAAETPSR